MMHLPATGLYTRSKQKMIVTDAWYKTHNVICGT